MRKAAFLFGLLFTGLSVFSQDAEAYFKIGEQKKSKEDYKGAAEAYSKVIEKDPKHINARLQRAYCYSAQGNYEASIVDYTEIIALHPEHKFSYLSRGSARNKLKKFNEAVSDFDKVLELDPSNQDAYNNRGWAKKGLGDSKGACQDWNKSKKMGNDEAKIILKNNKCK